MTLDRIQNELLAGIHRLLGGGGTKICKATTITGRFHTLYVSETANFTAVVGGGPGAEGWTTEIPAGSTLSATNGVPVTSFTTISGIVLAYS